MGTIHLGQGANASLQNKINISIVFDYIRRRGRSYRAQIARDLELSAPAVSRAVDHLIQEGLVLQQGIIHNVAGKKPAGLEINTQKGCVIALDVFKEHLKISAADMSGQIIVQSRGKQYAPSTDVVGDLIHDLDDFLSHQESPGKEGEPNRLLPVQAIVIGLPAVINAGTGVVRSAYLYESLENLDLCSPLAERYGVDVYVENDVKLAALAENRIGEGRFHEKTVYIDISDGIAAGIILNNVIFRGARGFAGEIGYMMPFNSTIGPEPQSKTKGYLEEHASVEGIRRQAMEAVNRGEATILSAETDHETATITGAAVFEAALNGDALGNYLIRHSAELMTVAIINSVLVIDPDVVIIGGDIFEMPGVEDLFLQPIREKMSRLLPLEMPEVHLSSLAADSCLIGASLFGIDCYLNAEYPYRIGSDLSTALWQGSRS